MKIDEYSAKLKLKIHLEGSHTSASVLIVLNMVRRPGFCVDILCDGVLVCEAVRREEFDANQRKDQG